MIRSHDCEASPARRRTHHRDDHHGARNHHRADLAWDNALDVRRTTMLLYRDQAIQVALGAENWIASILRQDLEDGETDHLGEIWASELPPLPIDGGDVFGAIEDLQGRFNVNNLIDADGKVHEESLKQFQRLAQLPGARSRVLPGSPPTGSTPILTRRSPTARKTAYTPALCPPYRAANQLLVERERAGRSRLAWTSSPLTRWHRTSLPCPAEPASTSTPPRRLCCGRLTKRSRPAMLRSLLSEREGGGFSDVENAFTSLVTPEAFSPA